MGSLGNQQTWVPYHSPKDCNQGFCSIYCPQWCYIIFPPPPPFGFSDDSSSPSFSPLVIAIIGILATAFLLVIYYTIISKYCANFDCLWWRLNPDQVDDDPGENAGSSRHHTWHTAASNGLDESIIRSIAVCKYKRGDGLVEGTDCSVCLNEFREDESLRLLPKCSHAFHVPCIDIWLKSHSNCPLCRSNIVSACTPLPELPVPIEPESSPPADQEIVAAMEDLERGGEEEGSTGNTTVAASKDPSLLLSVSGGLEGRDGIIEIGDDGMQPIRRSVSMDSSGRGRVSIADVLGMTMEDDFLMAKDYALSAGDGSSRRLGEEHGKIISRSRVLHCVMSPVPMKRSFSSGRFCFARQGKGTSSILPI